MEDKTFGLGMDAGRERRIRELCEEISRKRLAAKSRKRASKAFGLSERELLAIERMPGAMWTEDEARDMMTCQGFAPLPLKDAIARYKAGGYAPSPEELLGSPGPHPRRK